MNNTQNNPDSFDSAKKHNDANTSVFEKVKQTIADNTVVTNDYDKFNVRRKKGFWPIFVQKERSLGNKVFVFLILIFFGIFALIFFFIMGMFDAPIAATLEALENESTIVQALGSPIEKTSLTSGSMDSELVCPEDCAKNMVGMCEDMTLCANQATATLDLNVAGPKNTGTVEVNLFEKDDVWHVNDGEVMVGTQKFLLKKN
jgi:hypothetical protein